jgi:hypothetical protein
MCSIWFRSPTDPAPSPIRIEIVRVFLLVLYQAVFFVFSICFFD